MRAFSATKALRFAGFGILLELTLAAGPGLESGPGVSVLEIPFSVQHTFTHQQLDGDVVIEGHPGNEFRVEFETPSSRYESSIVIRPEEAEVRLRMGPDALRDDLMVWIPETMNLDLEVRNGHLHISGASGLVEIRSLDGDVEIIDASGPVLVDAHDGDVTVSHSVASPDITIALATLDGDIRLTLPPSFSGQIDMTTADGELDVQLPADENTDRSQSNAKTTQQWRLRRQTLELGSGSQRVQLRTLDGDIVVRFQ